MRAEGHHAKTACGNLQLCAGLKVVIEGVTHAMVQRILEKTRQRRSVEETGSVEREEEETESVEVDLIT